MPLKKLNCLYCKQDFTRKLVPAKIKHGRGKFCSVKCHNRYEAENPRFKLNREQELETIQLYRNSDSVRSIARKFDLSHPTISRCLKRNKLSVKTNVEQVRKYTCNTDKFDEIDSENKAYWLGFLMADAGIVESSLQFCLSAKDKDHVNEFRDFMESNSPVDTNNHRVQLRIWNVCLVKKLENLGINRQKTHHAHLPEQLPYKLSSHFIRGIFDGDGSVVVSFRRDRPSPTYYCEFLGAEPLLKTINHIIADSCSINLSKVSSHHGTYRIAWGGRLNFIKIRKFLYRGAIVFLKRKRQIFFSI